MTSTDVDLLEEQLNFIPVQSSNHRHKEF